MNILTVSCMSGASFDFHTATNVPFSSTGNHCWVEVFEVLCSTIVLCYRKYDLRPNDCCVVIFCWVV